jgi:hypothetical protein
MVECYPLQPAEFCGHLPGIRCEVKQRPDLQQKQNPGANRDFDIGRRQY